MNATTLAAPTTYTDRRNARQAAKWTIGETSHAARAARQAHQDAGAYLKLAMALAGPMPTPATERDAAIYVVANRMLEDYSDRFLAAKTERRRLITLRRHARAALASIRWTDADQRREDREEEAREAVTDGRAWRETYSRAYGDD